MNYRSACVVRCFSSGTIVPQNWSSLNGMIDQFVLHEPLSRPVLSNPSADIRFCADTQNSSAVFASDHHLPWGRQYRALRSSRVYYPLIGSLVAGYWLMATGCWIIVFFDIGTSASAYLQRFPSLILGILGNLVHFRHCFDFIASAN